MATEDLFENPAFLINLLSRSMSAHFNKLLQESGVEFTIEQMRILKVLSHKEGMTQQEIADLLVKEKPGITRQVDILAAKAFVERKSDPNDRRNNRIYLTEKARTLIEEVMKMAELEKKKLTKNIKADDMKTFKKVCRSVIENIQNAQK